METVEENGDDGGSASIEGAKFFLDGFGLLKLLEEIGDC